MSEKWVYLGLFRKWREGTSTWRSNSVAVALTLELAWVVLAFVFMIVLRAEDAVVHVDHIVFLILIHTGTNMVLVAMADTVEKKQLSEIFSWWIYIGLLVEVVLLVGSVRDLPDGRERLFVIILGALALAFSALEGILYMAIWAAGPSVPENAPTQLRFPLAVAPRIIHHQPTKAM